MKNEGKVERGELADVKLIQSDAEKQNKFIEVIRNMSNYLEAVKLRLI